MKSTNHIHTQNSRPSLRGLSQSVRSQICRLFAVLTALLTAASAGAVQITNTFNTAGTTTWTCPVGVTSISVAVQGGGGGGGGSTTGNNRIGAGGGGGACAFSPALTVVPGTAYTVTVGAGGTAGSTTGAGGTGGASSFSDGVIITLTANGGSGGGPNSTGVGGTGGTATGGTSNFSGGNGVNGAAGTTFPINAGAGGGGAGTDAAGSPGSGATGGAGGTGSPAGGKGANSPGADTAGSAGAAPGGGGSGGCKGTSASKGGGAGGKGQVTIVYTIPDSTTIVKANNTDNLTLGSSWTNGVAPDAAATATWDSTVTSANTVSLGADANWAGINIINPGGNVTINAGNTLTNGSSGIDMSSATVDLTLNCDLALGAANTWNVTNGRTLTVGGAVTGGFGITKQGAGTVTFSGLSATAANNYTGTTIIGQGTLAITTTSPAFSGGLTFGAAAGNTNVGVFDLSTTSATYTGAFLAQNNSTSANSISIGSGQTLQLNGTVTVGYNSSSPSTTKLAGTGLGTLAIGTSGTPINANVQIGNGQGNNIGNAGTVDLSGLAAFNAYLGTGTFRVGSTVNSGGGTGGAGGSTAILATNSTIQATTILLASPDSATQTLSLGSGPNVLNVSAITLANSGRSSGNLTFNGASGSLTVRGITGGSTRADLSLGVSPSFSTGTSVTGTFNTTGHSADLLFGTMSLGSRGASAAGSGNGTINFDTGTLDANDLKAGFVTDGTANATGNVNLSGGTATFNNTTAAIRLGDNAANAATATGNLNISGTANVTVAANGGSSIILGNAAVAGGTANGTVNLTGGSLTVAGNIIRGATTGTSTATLAIDGASTVLEMNGKNLTGLTSITYSNGLIRNLGTVNTGMILAGTDARVFEQGSGINGTIQGAITGTGVGLTKNGLGTLTLSGANDYSGNTTISAGKLVFSTAGSATSDVTVSSNATNGVLVAATDAQWVNTGSLTNQDNSILEINYGSTTPSTVNAPIVVNNYAVGTGLTLRVAGVGFSEGQSYPLVTWTGSGPSDTNAFAVVVLPPGPTVGGYLSVSGNTLYLNVVTVTVSVLSWNTGDGDWDQLTANWTNTVLNTAAAYTDGVNAVLFADADGATGNPVVNLTGAFSPLEVKMKSSSHDYTITNTIAGTGSIGGSSSLILDAANTRTLTLATSNSYTGGTFVNGGTLALSGAGNLGSAAGGVTMNGGQLDLGGLACTNGSVNITAAAASGATITNGTLSATAYTVTTTAGNAIITANLGGAGTFTKSGAGTVTLAGANTYTNLTTISAGTLIIDDGSIASSAGISNNAALVYNLNANARTYANAINGPGTLTKSGTNALTLSGTSTYTGGTTISAGTLQIGAGGTSGSIASTSGVTNNGSLVYNRSDSLTVTYPITGSGTVTKSSANTLTLTGDSTYTGGTTISAGTLQIGNGGTTGSIAATTGVTNNGALVYNRSDSLTVPYPISGSGNVTNIGAGTLTLAAASTFTGNLAVSTGIVKLNANDRLSASAGLDIAPNGTNSAILDLNGYNQTLAKFVYTARNAAGNLTIAGGANSTLTINSTNDTEIGPGGVNSSYDVTVNMSGLGIFNWNGLTNAFRTGLRLGSTNNGAPGTFTTTLASNNTINCALLAVGDYGSSSSGGISLLHLGQTNQLNVDTINVGASARSFAVMDFASGLTAPVVVIRGTNAANDAAARVTTWDVGRVAHTATGTWTATNDFSAGLVDARVVSLRIGRADTVSATLRAGTENAGFVMGKGTLDVTSLVVGQYASSAGGSIKSSSTYEGNGTFSLNDAAGTVTAESVILADNTGTATLNSGSVVNVRGTFNLNAGTLQTKSIDKGTDTGNANGTKSRNFNFSGGTVRNYPGFDLAIANVPINLTGSGSRVFESTAGQALTVASNSVISGIGGFTKIGAGTLTLNATNTYTGDTTVSAGTLLVNGSLAANTAVTVNGGALGGTGVINGLVTVNTGGTLSPGSSPGGLTINSNLVLNAGSTNLFEVDTTVPTNDVVVLGGTVTYGGVLKINPTGTFTAGQTFTLFSGPGATTPGNFASIQGSPGAGLGFTFTNGVLSVVSTGPAYPPAALLTNSLSGSTLTLSWPSNQGWRLEVQTNSLGVGLGTNWSTWPDSASTNAVSIPINSANAAVFYRLVYP